MLGVSETSHRGIFNIFLKVEFEWLFLMVCGLEWLFLMVCGRLYFRQMVLQKNAKALVSTYGRIFPGWMRLKTYMAIYIFRNHIPNKNL